MTSIRSSLPRGYTARPISLDDVPAVVRLFNRTSLAVMGAADYSESALRNELQSPGLDLSMDTLAIFDAAGEPVAYQGLYALIRPPVYPVALGRVDPDHMNRGLGSALLEWVDRRAARHLAVVPQHLRVAIRAFAYGKWQPSADLLSDHGYVTFRHGFKMRRDFAGEIEMPEWPDGIRVEVYRHPEEAEAVYRVVIDAFQDSFGYIREPFEAGFERFIHSSQADEAFDPDLWFLARAGDEIAGICLCSKWDNEDRKAGYVGSLGVRSPWRKLGIGRALLLHAFRAFQARGLQAATLAVDAGSLTGAVRLYEKAGMYIQHRWDRYEKVLREGEEISTTGVRS